MHNLQCSIHISKNSPLSVRYISVYDDKLTNGFCFVAYFSTYLLFLLVVDVIMMSL